MSGVSAAGMILCRVPRRSSSFGLRHLTLDLFLHGRRSIEEKAFFRILDLQDKQVDEHGHRRDRENDQPGDPHALRNPHDGLERCRRQAAEQDALAQCLVAVSQHEQRRTGNQRVRQHVQQVSGHRRRDMIENDVDARVRALDQGIGKPECARNRNHIAADFVDALEGIARTASARKSRRRSGNDRNSRDVAADDRKKDVESSNKIHGLPPPDPVA